MEALHRDHRIFGDTLLIVVGRVFPALGVVVFKVRTDFAVARNADHAFEPAAAAGVFGLHNFVQRFEFVRIEFNGWGCELALAAEFVRIAENTGSAILYFADND